MNTISKLILIFFVSIPLAFGLGSLTTKSIDVIKNNTGTDISLEPLNKVKITGQTNDELLIYNDGIESLTNGTEGQLLSIQSGVPTYIDPPASSSPTTNEGDLIIRGATEDERLPIGLVDQILISDGTTASWQDAPESLPDQTGNAGKALTTNGVNGVWDLGERLNAKIKTNLSKNPSFETAGDLGFVTTTALDLSGTTTRTVQATDFNKSKYSVQILTADTVKWHREYLDDYSDRQMVAYCEIKSNRDNVRYNLIIDGETVASQEIKNDGKWHTVRIPFVGGATSQKYEVEGYTSSVDTFSIDNCDMATSENEVQEISQAHFVGSIEWREGQTNCQWIRSSGTMGDFSSDADCSANPRIVEGSLIDSSSGILPQVTIPNARTDVNYKITASGSFYKSGANYICYFAFNYEDGETSSGNVYDSENAVMSPMLGENFRFTSSGDKVVKIQSKSNTGGQCILDGRYSGLKISIHAFPDATNTIVTQDTELTLETDNTLVARFDQSGSSTPTLAEANYDWIDSCSRTGTGRYRCVTKVDLVNSPSCFANSFSGNLRAVTIGYKTSDSPDEFTVNINSTSNAADDEPFNVTCTKNADEYNKSQTIIGNFDQIESVTGDLTAETGDNFKVRLGENGVVLEDEFDIIDGDCNVSGSGGSLKTCTLNTGIFTQDVFVQGTMCENNARTADENIGVTSFSSTSFSFVTQAITGSLLDHGSCLTISKTGSDIPKSFTGAIINASKMQDEIVDAVIENTKSDDLVKVSARNNSNESITSTNPVAFIEIEDEDNAWNGTVFTAPKTASYHFDGAVLWSGNKINIFFLYKDTGSGYNLDTPCSQRGGSQDIGKISCIVNLNQGDKVKITSNESITLVNIAAYHYLEIREMPTQQSIVANLLADEGMVRKCQTKYLSDDVTSNGGAITDLEFSNLQVGKKYQVQMNARFSSTSTDNTSLVFSYNTSELVNITMSPNNAVLDGQKTFSFIASESTTSAYASSLGSGSQLRGNGTLDETFVTLCQEPETTIFTTEW